MLQKQKLLFLVLTLFLSQLFSGDVFAQTNLEVLYPEIFGDAPTPGIGLPEYIKYIYNFAVTIIGFVIFGVLIYSGINYLLSAGNPEKLSEAKKGILAAFLGGILLLGAAIIFNTINPQLKILTPPPIADLGGRIPSGVYICNHKPADITNIIAEYMKSKDEKSQKEVVWKFLKAIYSGVSNYCVLAKTGDPRIREIKALFVVPKRGEQDPNTKEYSWEWDTAVIIKESKRVGGEATLGILGRETKCRFFPEIKDNKIFYEAKWDTGFLGLGSDIEATHITVIKKQEKPITEGDGVTLYEGRAYNTIEKWEKGKLKPPAELKRLTDKPKGDEDVEIIPRSKLEAADLLGKVKSISFDLPGQYVVALEGKYEHPGWINKNQCEVFAGKENIPDLTTWPIGQCGDTCMRYLGGTDGQRDEACLSCFETVWIVKY